MKIHPELDAILHKAEDKLKTAHLNFDNGQYDDTVSRAYYAAYHAMTAVLASQDLVFSSHAQTIGAFNREFVKTGKFPAEFAKKTQDLFAARQTGDYDAETRLGRETAEESLRDAEAVCAAVRQYLAPHLTAAKGI